MAIKKNPKFDLKLKYQKTFELSLIIGLLLLISAFKYFPAEENINALNYGFEDFIRVEDVINTKQDVIPPPPPKPPIPIEAPTDIVNDDVILIDNTIDVNANITTPPPPPPVDSEKENISKIFIAVEELPQPIGGIQAIQERIVYPEIAKKADVQGKVLVSVVIDENGNVINAKVVKGIGAGCDEAAIKAVMSTKFKPGKQRGKPVKVQVIIPISFKLN